MLVEIPFRNDAACERAKGRKLSDWRECKDGVVCRARWGQQQGTHLSLQGTEKSAALSVLPFGACKLAAGHPGGRACSRARFEFSDLRTTLTLPRSRRRLADKGRAGSCARPLFICEAQLHGACEHGRLYYSVRGSVRPRGAAPPCFSARGCDLPDQRLRRLWLWVARH